MNKVFTVTSQITLTMFRAQVSKDEPESNEIIYNFGHKGAYLTANVEVLLLWVCEVIAL